MKKLLDTTYYSIGLMSGTSLDGLDIVYCKFEQVKNVWYFEIIESETVCYSEIWLKNLQEAPFLDAFNFVNLNNNYGNLLGERVNEFLKKYKVKPDFIASHGHTVFHRPDMNLTAQIGSGANICAKTGLTTIVDFRSLDVALNGQGAPLVPIGDEYLFGKYDACINLGGFANVSFKRDGRREAFDICPVNIVVNELVKEIGLNYDKNGLIARKGSVNVELVSELNNLDFYKLNPPKSLGREWITSTFIPILNRYNILLEDKLRSIYEHIAFQICNSIKHKNIKNVLLTGGGVYNLFLIELIKEKTEKKVIIPSSNIIDFKEALIFAFLGVLRLRKENNCLSSVTGADYDNVGGCVFVSN